MSYQEIQDKVRKVRKEQECIGCLTKFPKGSMLRYRAYTWDGDFNQDYLCTQCDKVMDDMHPGDLEDGFTPGDLRNGWVDEEGNSI